MRFTTLFYGIVASASCAIVAATASSKHQAQQPIQVYLYPSPPSSHNLEPPTLTPDQAEAVLAHHFSAGEGVDEYEKLPGGHQGWAHLLSGGLFGGDGRGQRKEEDKARVVIVQGDMDVDSIIPSHLSAAPSFYLPSSSEVHTFLQPYLNRASSVVHHILASLPPAPTFLNDIFDVSTSKATQALSEQLQALSAIASRIPWTDRSRPPSDRWEAVKVKLSKGKEDDDIDSEVQKEGRNVVKAALEVMTTDPSQPPLVLIIMPSKSSRSHSHSHSRRTVDTATDFSTLKSHRTYNASCYPSNRTCTRASSDCSGHGTCVLVSNSTDGPESSLKTKSDECWTCRCSSGYLGDTCQKADYTFQTTLLIFTPILLLTVLMASVGLLSAIGGESLPSTLSLSVGAPNKRD